MSTLLESDPIMLRAHLIHLKMLLGEGRERETPLYTKMKKRTTLLIMAPPGVRRGEEGSFWKWNIGV